jgi:hypothetical protein
MTCPFEEPFVLGILCKKPEADCEHLWYHQNAGGDTAMCGREEKESGGDK